MEFLSSWWGDLSLTEQVLLIIALAGSIMLIIQIIMSFIGGDTSDVDGDVDVSIDGEAGIPFQFLTFKGFMAFMAVFGWTGIICIQSNMPIFWTVTISVIAGILTMLIMAAIMYGMNKLTEDGTMKIHNAIGLTGTVYLTIPPNRSGKGQVQITLNGLRTLDAYTDNDQAIKTGQFIEVVNVINDVLIVTTK